MGFKEIDGLKKWEPEYYSSSVIVRLGRTPQCFKCGRDAVKVDDTWVCPQCDAKEDTDVKSDIKDQDYYTRNGFKAKDIIKDLLTYLDLDAYHSWVVGNALKYICRYPFKGNWNQDLSKAQEYLEWLKVKED